MSFNQDINFNRIRLARHHYSPNNLLHTPSSYRSSYLSSSSSSSSFVEKHSGRKHAQKSSRRSKHSSQSSLSLSGLYSKTGRSKSNHLSDTYDIISTSSTSSASSLCTSSCSSSMLSLVSSSPCLTNVCPDKGQSTTIDQNDQNTDIHKQNVDTDDRQRLSLPELKSSDKIHHHKHKHRNSVKKNKKNMTTVVDSQIELKPSETEEKHNRHVTKKPISSKRHKQSKNKSKEDKSLAKISDNNNNDNSHSSGSKYSPTSSDRGRYSCQTSISSNENTSKNGANLVETNPSSSNVGSSNTGDQDSPKRNSTTSTTQNHSSGGSLWVQLWQPSYKNRLNQFQRQFSDIGTKEKLVDDFMCALQRDILCQGRLYVSLNFIAFYSNILGYETVLTINYRDIKSISKATTIKLFPNAIDIVMWNGRKYFFTSFVTRDRAYKLIHQLWTNTVSDQQMPWPEVCKLIRDSYTTNDLGINLSEIDDADAIIDLSKKKIKKKKLKSIKQSKSSKRFEKEKSNGNEESVEKSSHEDEDDFGDDDDEVDYGRNDGCRNRSQTLTNNEMAKSDSVELNKANSELKTIGTNTADDISIWSNLKSIWRILSNKCMDYGKKIIPNESNGIRVLLLFVILLLMVQLVIFVWIVSFNYRLEEYHHLLSVTIEQELNNEQEPSQSFNMATSNSALYASSQSQSY